MNDDERAIRELIDTWMTASQAGDIETVLGLMTDGRGAACWLVKRVVVKSYLRFPPPRARVRCCRFRWTAAYRAHPQ